MKKIVERPKSKQTVWVLTMLTVMVVLSAYYLASDPIINQNIVQQNEDPTTETTGSDVSLVDLTTISDQSSLLDKISSNVNDLFVSLKMEREANRTKQLDQLYVMINSNLSEDAIAGIHDKIETLMVLEESELVLEKLIMSEGFNDAVVLSNEKSVDVIVQAETLTNAQAVKIIKMVSDRLDVPAVNVHIKRVD